MKGLRRALVVVALITASVLSKLEGREAVRLMEVKLEVKDWKAGRWRKQGREGPRTGRDVSVQGREGPGTGSDVSVQGSDHRSVPARSHPTGHRPRVRTVTRQPALPSSHPPPRVAPASEGHPADAAEKAGGMLTGWRGLESQAYLLGQVYPKCQRQCWVPSCSGESPLTAQGGERPGGSAGVKGGTKSGLGPRGTAHAFSQWVLRAQVLRSFLMHQSCWSKAL